MGTVTKQETLSADVSSHDTTNLRYASIASGSISNAYHGSANTTYVQLNLTTGSSAETYIYLKFDLSAIPANATIQSVSAKVKGYISSTNSSRISTRQMQLATGTTLKGSALTISNSATEKTFSNVGSWTRSELLNAGVRYYVKRGTSNTSSTYYIRVYGATITVTYQYQATTYAITVQNTSSATVTVSDDEPVAGTSSMVQIDDITGLIVTDNGNDITSQFQVYSSSGYSYPTSYATSGSINGTNYQSTIGKGSDTANRTGNDYFSTAQGGSGSATITYLFDFSSIPSNAVVNSVTVTVKGHCEDPSQSREIAQIQLYSGSLSTDTKGSPLDLTTTTDQVYTMSAGTWTRAELDNARMVFTIGVYGGLISGATWTVNYSLPGVVYVISNISADHIIAVSTAASSKVIYFKNNGVWTAATAVYKKVSGSWVLQTDLTGAFDVNVNYVKG